MADLPWVLTRPPWIFRKSPRPVEPVSVKAKKTKETEEALAQFTSTAVFGGWRSDNDARAWAHYETHVEDTLLALLPIAIGEWGPKRKIAERILRVLAQRRGQDVREVAAGYGKKAKASVEEILTIDPRLDCPGAPPDMSKTWQPSEFTRPRLRDGSEMSLEAVEHLGHMLAFSSLDRGYAGIADVKDACDARSLAELAWDAASAWEAAGASRRDEWIVEAIAHLGDDVVVRRTTPALKSKRVLDVLAACGTDAAATEICTVVWRLSQGKKADYGVADAQKAFAALARRRGLTVDELEDTLAPTILPAPPIQFGVDDRLDPFMQTAGGTRHHTLPPTSTWRDLQEDVAAVSDARIRSLERAMVSGRSWSVEAFRKAWLDHSLMQHVSRCVVWRTNDRMFRVAEDGTFADARDDDVAELGKLVAIVHPAELDDEQRAKWIAVLADYRVVQPFEQMARRVISGAKGASVALFPIAPTTSRELYDKLAAHGFTLDRGSSQSASRACARTNGRIVVALAFANQSLSSATLRYERAGKRVDLDAAHAVDVSEVGSDLDLTLRGSAP